MSGNTIANSQMRIYTKKGRWLGLLALCAAVPLLQYLMYIAMRYWLPESGTYAALAAISLPGIAHILLITLFLVPYYFKQNLYRKFWVRMLLVFVTCSTAEFVVLRWLVSYELLQDSAGMGIWEISICAFNQLNVVILATGLLYFYEFFEEIYLARSTRGHIEVIRDSIRRMQGTRTDLPYLLQSLRGIRNQLNQKEHAEAAGDSILLFADILRYKLYGYEQELVTVSEEFSVLSDLVRFYNVVLIDSRFEADVQLTGEAEQVKIEKQLLLRLIYPFISESENPQFMDLLFFIEMSEEEVNLTIQYEPILAAYHLNVVGKLRQTLKDRSDILNFEITTQSPQIQINICLKVQT